ncbi:right-handed parallel beta-helix repeat-containing protein [Catellatospora aurea]|uniref:Right-handed parallel beta-helix repeat-containing protein n=1 Tax=Catellatospora aurea TaxID=1337874 RepID=A0ABW2GV02_9ACTN
MPALIAAINTANTTPGADTLTLTRRCTYALVAADNPGNGLPIITGQITINGNGATITRRTYAPNFRILHVGDTGTLVLNNLTVSHGSASDCPIVLPTEGLCGGGILNLGTLTVNRSRVIDNSVIGGPDFFAAGGGIENIGTATVTHSEIHGNKARYTGSAPEAAATGGGIDTAGPLTIEHSRLTGNLVSVTAGIGGFAFGTAVAGFAPVTIWHSVVADNDATAPGGTARGAVTGLGGLDISNTKIIRNTSSAPGGTATAGGVAASGTVTIARTTVAGNTAQAPGGSVFGGGVRIVPGSTFTITSSNITGNVASATGGTAQGGGLNNLGTVNLSRTTIAGNRTTGATAQGGGLFNAATATATLTNSPVTRNRAAGTTTSAGGGIFNDGGTVTLNASPVVANAPDNCSPPASITGCSG